MPRVITDIWKDNRIELFCSLIGKYMYNKKYHECKYRLMLINTTMGTWFNFKGFFYRIIIWFCFGYSFFIFIFPYVLFSLLNDSADSVFGPVAVWSKLHMQLSSLILHVRYLTYRDDNDALQTSLTILRNH